MIKILACIVTVFLFGCASGEKQQESKIVETCKDKAGDKCDLFEPADGRVLLFVGQDINAVGGLEGYHGEKKETGFGGPGDNGYLDDPELPRPAGFTSYTNPNITGLFSYDNWGSGDTHLDKQLEDKDFDYMAVALGFWMGKAVTPIGNGELDSALTVMGDYLKSLAPRPVFLRIGFEFNLHYKGDEYIKAFKHIRDMYDAMEITNVAYVWQSNGENLAPEKLREWYPDKDMEANNGKQYVDWMAYSYFLGLDKKFMEPAPGTTMLELAKVENKPVFIAEACPNLLDYSKAEDDSLALEWNKRFFKQIDDNSHIKAISYINVDWKNQNMWKSGPDSFFWVTTDSRLQLNEKMKSLWIEEMKNPKWILQTEDLFTMLRAK